MFSVVIFHYSFIWHVTWHGFRTTSEIDQDSFDIWWKLMFSSYYQSTLCHFHTFNWDLLLTKLIMISWELRHNHNQKVSNLSDMKHEVTWHDMTNGQHGQKWDTENSVLLELGLGRYNNHIIIHTLYYIYPWIHDECYCSRLLKEISEISVKHCRKVWNYHDIMR